MSTQTDAAYAGAHTGQERTGQEEEIRFAVVLNGGVSLAVWMGGVAGEIDRVTRRQGTYGELLKLVRARARADVIAGTSAGGINGAALALAQVNAAADIGQLRDLWLEQGRMDALLQKPFRGSPASLLRGDDYFLPKLNDALQRLCEPWQPNPAADRPVELIITTTLLHGARLVSVDSLGQQLPQLLHDGRFTFVREDPDAVVGTAARNDLDPAGDPHIAARLALAARCSAGFPVAFEPCFVPARDKPRAVPDQRDDLELSDPARRPDLGPFVSWRDAGPAGDVPPDRSRYAVDGGALANTPTQPALEAIAKLPASDLVQRVMLLVYPHAPLNKVDPADRTEEPPTVTSTMGGLIGALLSRGNRTFVNEVENYNKAAAARRGARLDVMDGLENCRQFYDLAKAVFPQYRNQRIRRAARDLAGRMVPPADWSYERIRRAADAAQREWREQSGPQPSLPYVPYRLPEEGDPPPAHWGWGITAAVDLADAALDLLHRVLGIAPGSDASACKELAEAKQVTSNARTRLAAIRKTVDDPWIADPALVAARPGVALWTVRLAHYARTMGNDPTKVAAAERKLLAYEREQDLAEAARLHLDETTIAARQDRLREALARLPETAADGVAGAEAEQEVGRIVDAVLTGLDILGRPSYTTPTTGPEPPQLRQLRMWERVFVELPADDGTETGRQARRQAVRARLLWLHVAAWTTTDAPDTDTSYPVDLVQVSLQTQNDFAKQSVTVDDKVGGMELNRFGGFLKRSWRMNDWTWGRMDAATMLCQIILSPARLRRRAIREEHEQPQVDPHAAAVAFVEELMDKLYAGEPPAAVKALEAEAVGELEQVYRLSGSDGDLPASLPALAAIAAWAVHLRTVVEELPAIATAVRADRYERANRYSKGELFVAQNASLLGRLPKSVGDGPLSEEEIRLGEEALDAFDRAGIGREPLAEEARSDQMIRTATTAASVAATVADSSRSGLTAIKPVTRSLRGGALIPYWTVQGLAAGGAIARFLALSLLGAGAVLVTLSLLGVIHGWIAGPATAIGVAALLTAFGFAALRTGTLLHSVVLLTPLIPLVAFATEKWRDEPPPSLVIVAAVLALVLGLMLLGSLPAQLGTPIATIYRGLDRVADRRRIAMTTGEDGSEQAGLRRWRALGSWSASLAGRLVLLAAAVTGLVLLARWIDGQADDWRSEHLAIVLITAALAVISWPLGYRAGWRLRSWVDRGKVGKPEWRIVGVKHAAGVMAAWSVLYGTVFLVVAAAILWRWPVSSTSMWAWQAALATAVVFAVLLLYVLPLAVILTAIPLTVRRLVAEVDAELLTWPDRVLPPAAVVDLLRRRDLGHRCLLRRARTLTPTGEARRATWQRFCDSGSGWLAPPIRNVGITRLARRLYSKPDSGRLALAAGGRRLDLRLLKHVKKVRQQTSG